MGGSFYISLSKGWFCIKCHLLIETFFRFVTAGWYCVTTGRILLCALIFCRSADFLSLRISPLRELCLPDSLGTSHVKEWSECCDILLERIFCGVGLKTSKCFAFDPWWVAGREMCILKCFCWLVVSSHIKDRCFSKCIPFVNTGIQGNCFFVWYFSRKFDGWSGWCLLACSVNLLNVYVSKREQSHHRYIFSTQLFFCVLALRISVSTAAMNRLAKETAILVPITIPCIWFFQLNWKEFSLSISMRKRVGIGGLLLWKHSYALHTVVMPSPAVCLCTSWLHP